MDAVSLGIPCRPWSIIEDALAAAGFSVVIRIGTSRHRHGPETTLNTITIPIRTPGCHA